MSPPPNPLSPPDRPGNPSRLPKIAWGKGSYVYDIDGNRYIDGSGGPAVFCIGHGNTEVNEAIKAQLDRVALGYRYTFTSDPLEQLTEIVQRRCGGTLKRVVFLTGGSEAVESCLKIALQYHAARGEMSRRRFISRQRSWHGNTLGALSVSGFQGAARAVRGRAGRRELPVAGQRVPAAAECAQGRRGRPLRRRAGAGDPARRAGEGRGLHLRARGRRRRRRGAGAARLCQAACARSATTTAW